MAIQRLLPLLLAGAAVYLFWFWTAGNLSLGGLVLLLSLSLAVLGSPWRYTCSLLLLWTVIPFVRRLIDWQAGYGSISALSALPLVALLVPGFALLAGGWQRLDRSLAALAWVWVVGFAYALALALPSGNAAPGLYSFAQFCLPVLPGLWLATWATPPARLYARLGALLLLLAGVVGIYGIVQYIAPPVWDAYWMVNSGMGAPIGKPQPFEVRVFSLLNSPAICAAFLMLSLLWNLPRLGAGRPWELLLGGLALVGLALTLVRSVWLACVLGFVAFALLSPQRQRVVVPAVILVALGALLPLALGSLVGSNQPIEQLQNRLNTLSNLETDVSFNERRALLDDSLATIVREPLGQGLGTTGTAAKLGSASQTVILDNGYLARLLEMGIPGSLCYLGSLIGSVVALIRRWWRATPVAADLCAAAVALHVSLLVLDIAGDQHQGLVGLCHWLSLSLALAATRPQPGAERVPQTLPTNV